MNNYFTSKELFLKIMNFEHCKRTLNWEFGYWGGTLNRWYKEGLPEVKGFSEKLTYSQSIPGSAIAAGSPSWNGTMPKKDFDVANYFNFDKGFSLVPYHYWIFPLFEKRKLFS